MINPVGNPLNSGAVWAAASQYNAYLSTASYVWDCKGRCRAIYESLVAAEQAQRPSPRVTPGPRAERNHPTANWAQVWANIASKVLPERIRDTWYECVHDIVPTNDLKYARKVKNVLTPECVRCGLPGTLTHRLCECEMQMAYGRGYREC